MNTFLLFWVIASLSAAVGWFGGFHFGYRKGFHDARWIISRKY